MYGLILDGDCAREFFDRNRVVHEWSPGLA